MDRGGAILRSETVSLEADTAWTRVTGHYSFLRRDQRSDMWIYYPIMGTGPGDRPGAISATICCDGGKELPLQLTHAYSGATWRLPFSSAESCDVRVRYAVRSVGRRAEYALTTARGWPEPIGSAKLVVALPAGARITTSSYPLMRRSHDSPVFVYEAVQFAPDRDLVVEWEQ